MTAARARPEARVAAGSEPPTGTPQGSVRHALLRPWFLAALAVLVVNDHLLKGAGLLPGWVTGKLSDFAGLLVAAALLCVMLGVRTRRVALLAHVAVGIGFAALEMSAELTAAADLVYRAAGFDWQSWSDPTDLLALLVLPASYAVMARGLAVHARVGSVSSAAPGAAKIAPLPRRAMEASIAAFALLACIASNGGPGVAFGPPCGGPDCDQDGWSPPEDCNDNDPSLGPGAGCPNADGEVWCDDGEDDDDDGTVDCADSDCAFACADLIQECQTPTIVTVPGANVLEGSTVGAASVTEGECVGADTPEVLFGLNVTVPGVLRIGAPEDHAVYARTSCIGAHTEIGCLDPLEPDADFLEIAIDAPQSITVVVEADDALFAASFEAPIAFLPHTCGDGVHAEGEECDDGNLVALDGCSELCTAELDVLCASLPVLAVGQTQGSFETGATTSFVGSCGGSFASQERAYQLVPDASGQLVVTVDASEDVVVYATTGCGEDAFDLGCVDDVPPESDVLQVPVQAGVSVTIVVELAEPGPGTAFDLDVSIIDG